MLSFKHFPEDFVALHAVVVPNIDEYSVDVYDEEATTYRQSVCSHTIVQSISSRCDLPMVYDALYDVLFFRVSGFT